MNTANKLYRFTTDADKIDEFINDLNINKRIYEALKDTNFALKLTATSSVHYIAVDICGDRFVDDSDYDFNETEVKLFLDTIEHAEQPIDAEFHTSSGARDRDHTAARATFRVENKDGFRPRWCTRRSG